MHETFCGGNRMIQFIAQNPFGTVCLICAILMIIIGISTYRTNNPKMSDEEISAMLNETANRKKQSLFHSPEYGAEE